MLVRRIARPMLAAIFITGGVNALRHPTGHAQQAEPIAPKLADKLPFSLPQDTESLVKIDAGVKIVAGLLLASSRVPRLAAAALAVSLVPTTLAGHPFWKESDAAAKQQQQINFVKNISVLGGLLLATVDTEGKPSLRWRATHLADFAKAKAVDALPIP